MANFLWKKKSFHREALRNLEMVILQYALFSMWAFISVPAASPQELFHNCSKIACYTAQRFYTYFFILLYGIASTSTCKTSRLVCLSLPRMSQVDWGDQAAYFCANVKIKNSKLFIWKKRACKTVFALCLLDRNLFFHTNLTYWFPLIVVRFKGIQTFPIWK